MNREDRHVRIVLPSDAGSDDGDNEQSRVNRNTKPDKSLILVGMSYAACSGTLSGLSLLFAKCGVELLVITFASGGKENQFKSIQSWILLVGLGFTALAQLFYLNHSLRLAGPALICPLAFCFYNISSIFGECCFLSWYILTLIVAVIDGLVFYSQFSELSRLQISLVTCGIVVLLIGVWSVSAIEPTTGESGVHLGTWVDDISEDECDVSEENRVPFTDEPEIFLAGESAVESAPATPVLRDQGQFGNVTWPKSARHQHPSALPSHLQGDPVRRHSLHTRYGTLIPELAPPGLPAGFSIGFNTSSPGFAIRSVHGHGTDAEQASIWGGRRRHSMDNKGRSAKRGLSLDMDALRDLDSPVSAGTSLRSAPPGSNAPIDSAAAGALSRNEGDSQSGNTPSSRRSSWTARLFRGKAHSSDQTA